MLLHRSAALGDRALLSRLTEAVEAARAPQTVVDEIDDLLGELKIPVTNAIRQYLFWAASRKLGSTLRPDIARRLDPDDVLGAIIEPNQNHQVQDRDPSAMLREAAKSLGGVDSEGPLPPPWDLPANPDKRLVFSPNLRAMLQRGWDVQRRVFLNPALGTKGFIAAYLTPPRSETPASDQSIIAIIVGRFQEVIRRKLPDEEARRWNRALERETSTFPRLNVDQPSIGPPTDMLGISMDALAIANVAAGKSTSLPLAFGIFGDWGSGKSFFMRLIQEQIAGIVRSKATDDGFEHAIVQIQFNAWHYAETNLWASLVGHIFEELDRWMRRGEKDESTTRVDDILNRLSTSRQLTLEAATELMHRRKEHAKAGAKLTEAQATLVEAEKTATEAPWLVWRTIVDMARTTIANDPEIRRELADVETALAVQALGDSKTALTGALQQLDRSTSAVRTTLGALRSALRTWRTIAFVVGGLLGVPLLLLCGQWIMREIVHRPEWGDIGIGVKAMAGVVTAAAVLVRSVAQKAKLLADKVAGLKKTSRGADRQGDTGGAQSRPGGGCQRRQKRRRRRAGQDRRARHRRAGRGGAQGLC